MLKKLGFFLPSLLGAPFHCGVRRPDGFEGPDGVPPVEVKPNLAEIIRYRGRRVARLPAVMARPCSMSDQMAMSTVA